VKNYRVERILVLIQLLARLRLGLGQRRSANNTLAPEELYMKWVTRLWLKFTKPKAKLQLIANILHRQSAHGAKIIRILTSDNDREVRRAAMLALVMFEGNKALPTLISALADAEPEVRLSAANALAKLHEPQAIPSLVQALDDSDPNVRTAAAHALEALSWKPRTEPETISFSVATGKYDAAAEFGTAALEPLIKALKNPDSPNRFAIPEALGQIQDTRVVRTLIEALRDSNQMVRLKAAEALGKFKDDQAVGPLVRCLRDDFAGLRAAACTSLGKLGDKRCIERVAELLDDPQWEVRKAAVKTLARLGADNLVNRLKPLLADPDHDVREAVVESLAKCNETSALQCIILALADVHDSVRRTAERVIKSLNPQWWLTQAARNAVPELEKAKKDRDYWKRQAAIRVLQKITEATEAETELVTSAKKTVTHPNGHELVEALDELLKDPDRDLRLAGAEVLSRLANQSVSSSLQALLQDPDQWVRSAATQALEKLSAR